jgi:hypothetical protein
MIIQLKFKRLLKEKIFLNHRLDRKKEIQINLNNFKILDPNLGRMWLITCTTPTIEF